MDIGTKYELIRDIGSGNFGVAKLCRARDTGELVAVKYIERGEKIDKNVEREIINHRMLSGHPNIVRFREVFLTSTHLGIAMEYASGGELFDRIVRANRFSEDEARYFFQQLISGVAWCHKEGVCHRDLKLENTLLDGRPAPRLKICDFGYSKSSVTDSTPKTTVGTPAYIAPEVFSGDKYEGEPADVWSCGVALYTMLVGAYPFQDPDHPSSAPRMVQRIIRGQYSIPPEISLSPACLDMLGRMFVRDPAQRITLAQLRQHPWFLVNLPRECQGAGELLQCEPPRQTEADILAIITAARTRSAAAVAAAAAKMQHLDSQEFNEEEHLAEMMEGDGYLE